jgi:phosphoribosylanthranilate isomerase
MLKVKICGVTNVPDALAAAEEGADYIGLIFAPSPRRVNEETAREVVSRLPQGVEPVGVFMNQPLEEVHRILQATGLGIAQLHGSEPPDFCRDAGVPVFKVFDPGDERFPGCLEAYDTFAFLLDLPKNAPPEARIDPERAALAKPFGRVFLAGKLTSRNVSDLVARVRPYGVDTCGGTEKAPGLKDRSKLRDFIQAAREALPS